MVTNSVRLFFIILLVSAGCNTIKKDESNNIKSTVDLILMDSARIDYLGLPTIHDLNPNTGDVLFMEHKESGNIIHIAKFDGHVKESFTKSGDFPDSYGILITNLLLSSDSAFLAYGTKGLLTYNFSGELISTLNPAPISNPNSILYGMGKGLQRFEDKLLLPVIGIDRNIYRDLAKYKEVKNILLIDSNTGNDQRIINLPSESRFLNGNYFFVDAWQPVFTIDNDQIHVAFGIEPTIYSYSLQEPFSLINSIELNLPDFKTFGGFKEFNNDLRFIGLRQTTGKINNVKFFMDYILVSYSPGYNQEDTEERFRNKSPEDAVKYRENMEKKYKERLAVFNRSGELLNNFIPEELGVVGGSMLLRDGQLWVMGKPDPIIERDYFMLYRLDLKQIEEK